MEYKHRTFGELKDAICRDVQAIQEPGELMIMITHALLMFAPIRVCMEAGVFRYLAEAQKPVSVQTLTANALRLRGELLKQAPNPIITLEQIEFMTRMLSAVCTCKLVDEIGPGAYLANDMTKSCADTGSESGFRYIYGNVLGPQSSMSSIVEWVIKSGYTAPSRATEGPFQEARGITGRTAFQHWAEYDVESLLNLSSLMKRVQKDRLSWSAWFPSEALFNSALSLGTGTDDGVFMVDIGGNLGHDLSAFAAKYPEHNLRLVLQDLAPVVKGAEAEGLDPRIEFSVHDFFEPQPIKSASIYFLHKIFHDWPDSDCVTILQHVRDAMAPDSRIFINEAIIPDQDNSFTLAAFDITMLIQVSGKERSKAMWRNLIGQVEGLEIAKFWESPKMMGESILEIARKESISITT